MAQPGNKWSQFPTGSWEFNYTGKSSFYSVAGIIKRRDLCMNILNEIIYWYLVVGLLHFCVFIALMSSVCSTAVVLMCVVMCVCRILIKITHLLIYLLTFS